MSSSYSSLRLSSSSLKIEEESLMAANKQGISSILAGSGSDERAAKSSSSLRRTLSADMSSAKWLTQHSFSSSSSSSASSSPIKKIASSQQFSVISDSSSEEEECEKESSKEPTQFDIWSSILLQNAKEDSNKSELPPPYVPPLVKRLSSALSKKSLEFCTESLGSETGSDGFSSYPPSETSDVEDDNSKEIEQQVEAQETVIINTEILSFNDEDMKIPKYNYAAGKKSTKRSFPPPIPSLHRQGDGASVRMECRRDNGRLVLEAVSVPSTNNFLAQRQDGRLVLTFANKKSSITDDQEEPKDAENEKGTFEDDLDCFENDGSEVETEKDDEEMDSDDDDDDDDDEFENDNTDNMEIIVEKAPEFSNRMISLHRLTLMVNKPMSLVNANTTWCHKFNEVVKSDDVEQEKQVQPSMVAKSLPPRPKMSRAGRMLPTPSATAVSMVGKAAAGTTFNPYEYYWKPKPMNGGPTVGPIKEQVVSSQEKKGNNNDNKLFWSPNININNNNKKMMKSVENEREMFVLRGNKGDYLVPMMKGCKEEPRRSLLFWEPYCIATS